MGACRLHYMQAGAALTLTSQGQCWVAPVWGRVVRLVAVASASASHRLQHIWSADQDRVRPHQASWNALV